MGCDPLRQLVPIHLGHYHVREHNIEGLCRAKRDRLPTATSRSHRVAGALKRKGQKGRYLRLVINNENSGSICHVCPSPIHRVSNREGQLV